MNERKHSHVVTHGLPERPAIHVVTQNVGGRVHTVRGAIPRALSRVSILIIVAARVQLDGGFTIGNRKESHVHLHLVYCVARREC